MPITRNTQLITGGGHAALPITPLKRMADGRDSTAAVMGQEGDLAAQIAHRVTSYSEAHADTHGVLGARERLEGVVTDLRVDAAAAILDVDQGKATFLRFIDDLGADGNRALVIRGIAVALPAVDEQL